MKGGKSSSAHLTSIQHTTLPTNETALSIVTRVYSYFGATRSVFGRFLDRSTERIREGHRRMVKQDKLFPI